MEENQVVPDQLPPLSAKYPWLVAQTKEVEEQGTRDQVFYTIKEPMCHYRCRIPELLGRRIRGCFHGWVILSNDLNHVMWCLWNPVTCKIKRLPPLILRDGDPESIGECCLSSPPDDPNSLLLLTRTDISTFVFCRLDRKRKRLRWTEMSYSKQLKRITGDGHLLSNLTCCNGKVYASSTDGFFDSFVIQVDILVKDRQVVIRLFLLSAYPIAPYNQCSTSTRLLKGSGTDLFFIEVGFREETTVGYVCLFKLDITRLNWEIIDSFRDRDMSRLMDEVLAAEDLQQLEMSSEMQDDIDKLDMTREMWEEVLDLKDAIFFLDLSGDKSVFFSHTEFGGYIHIRIKKGTKIHSYHFKDKTISISSMPSTVLPTSHMSVWEFIRLEADHGEAKCTIDSEQVKDGTVVRRLVTVDEVGPNESYLLNLPLDILEMITNLCVGLDYINFRATCKRCHLAAPETPLMRLQMYSPWLMELDNDRRVITFTNPMLGDMYFIKNVPVSIHDIIRSSSYGWLLFYNHLGDLVFYNPFTGEIRELPRVGFCFPRLCFSAPPTSPDCMVVGITREDVYIHFIAREPSWRRLRLDFRGDAPYSFCIPMFYGRDIYVLCNNGTLHVIKDLGQEDCYREQVVETPRRSSSPQYFVMRRDQHFLLVILDERGESVEVFKLNDSTKGWEKIDGLGRYMIYICDATCICIEAKSRHMENKIYFAQMRCGSKRMVFYSLQTQMFHTFNGKNIDETFGYFDRTYHRHLYPHTWIEPSWS